VRDFNHSEQKARSFCERQAEATPLPLAGCIDVTNPCLPGRLSMYEFLCPLPLLAHDCAKEYFDILEHI